GLGHSPTDQYPRLETFSIFGKIYRVLTSSASTPSGLGLCDLTSADTEPYRSSLADPRVWSVLRRHKSQLQRITGATSSPPCCQHPKGPGYDSTRPLRSFRITEPTK